MKFAQKFGVGSSLETYLRKVFYPTAKSLAGETSNFAELPPTHCQSEARTFKMAQNIDKQKPGVSSMINTLKSTKLGGITPTGF